MLPKVNRLKKKKDFERVFKEGRGAKGKFVYVKAVSNDSGMSRFGIVISKKVSKQAIIRNKEKRRIRAVIRKNIDKLKNVDCIILFSSLPPDFSSIEKEVEDLFYKLNIYD